MEMILDLQEDNKAKVKDALTIWQNIKMSTNIQLSELKEDMTKMNADIDSSTGRIEDKMQEVNSLIRQIASKPHPNRAA
jgi:hypothetical protein